MITVRNMEPCEINCVAELLSIGYYEDVFFKWLVENDKDRRKIVADYYKTYLNAAGCVAHVAENAGDIIGAAVWLPHDVDASIYNEIDEVTGIYAHKFRMVSDKSHYSEPPMQPFYQLVGFVVLRDAQGEGVGTMLLKFHLDGLDELGIPTYLEASTPYIGGGVYGRFGYQPVGELMVFACGVELYPLWRPAKENSTVTEQQGSYDHHCRLNPQPHDNNRRCDIMHFGGYGWRVLEVRDNKALLLMENVITMQPYNDVFESVTWKDSTARNYLNTVFYNTFMPDEQLRIAETPVHTKGNTWFGAGGGEATMDKIFLLSDEEVVNYCGDSGQLKSPENKFYIDDKYNDARHAVGIGGTPCRWVLRTKGNLPYLAAAITVDGRIAITGDFVNRRSSELFNVGIRPAMWVNLSKKL